MDARQVKNVSGRKTDVLDCQWLQQLHTYGLLKGAFRPKEEICELRSYVRQRQMLIQSATMQIHHMQKALTQMNVQLHHVITNITGETGMNIIRAIVAGERNPKVLASYRDPRCKNSLNTIELALAGHYRSEHLFSLKQALELYDVYQLKIQDCDERIELKLQSFSIQSAFIPPMKKKTKGISKNAPAFDLRGHLIEFTGVDLTEIPGVNTLTALNVIGEIGLDMDRWKSAKHFASWLGLCPGNKVSGGKHLSGRTKPCANKAAAALRVSASTLYRNGTALGAYLRRLKGRLGPAKATTAVAHKIAKIIYQMLKYRVRYKEIGQDYYEKQYHDRLVKSLTRRAEELGFNLIPVGTQN